MKLFRNTWVERLTQKRRDNRLEDGVRRVVRYIVGGLPCQLICRTRQLMYRFKYRVHRIGGM